MPLVSKRQAEEIPPHLECAICWKVRILICLQASLQYYNVLYIYHIQ